MLHLRKDDEPCREPERPTRRFSKPVSYAAARLPPPLDWPLRGDADADSTVCREVRVLADAGIWQVASKGQRVLPSRRKDRRRRRPRQQAAGTNSSTDPVIGWFAQQGTDAVCDGDALIIAGTEAKLIRILQIHRRDAEDYQIRPATAREILALIPLGAAYCFDEEAYARFLAPARAAGLPLKDEDFSDPGPIGIHLIRIGYLPLPW
jgi:hypothetical protein